MSNNIVKKTSKEWCEELNIEFDVTGLSQEETVTHDDPILSVMDADGWNRNPGQFRESFLEEKISRGEFMERVKLSTISFYKESNALDFLQDKGVSTNENQ